MHTSDGQGSIAHCECDAFGCAGATVPCGEDSGTRCFQQRGARDSDRPRSLSDQLGACDHEALFIFADVSPRKPVQGAAPIKMNTAQLSSTVVSDIATFSMDT